MAGLMSRGHNLLVLDEPTNHLDIPSAERLEEALRRYNQAQKRYSTAGGGGGGEGTLILITHKAPMLELVDRLVVDFATDRNQLQAAGAGYLAPTASNLTPEGRAANRRVEVVLLSLE